MTALRPQGRKAVTNQLSQPGGRPGPQHLQRLPWGARGTPALGNRWRWQRPAGLPLAMPRLVPDVLPRASRGKARQGQGRSALQSRHPRFSRDPAVPGQWGPGPGAPSGGRMARGARLGPPKSITANAVFVTSLKKGVCVFNSILMYESNHTDSTQKRRVNGTRRQQYRNIFCFTKASELLKSEGCVSDANKY